MERVKQFIIILVCCCFAFLPVMADTHFSYADDTPSAGGGSGNGWVNISTHEETVAAFKAYCKSRNFKYNHTPTVLQEIVKFDYDQLQKACEKANISIDGLNAEIWYSYNQSPITLKWFFSKTAMSQLNALYSTLLEDYDMRYDQEQEKTIYSGYWYEDDEGNGCYAYVIDATATSYKQYTQEEWDSLTKGSIYQPPHFGSYLSSLMVDNVVEPYSFHKNGVQYTYYLRKTTSSSTNRSGVNVTSNSNGSGTLYIYNERDGATENGYVSIGVYTKANPKNQAHIIAYKKIEYTTGYDTLYGIARVMAIEGQTTSHDVQADQGEPVQPVTNNSLTINTSEETINNYITNDSHDTYNYNDTDEPPSNTTPLPSTPDYPSGGTINPDGSINWTMPDLDIDFNLDFDLSDVFPFSIPFDIIDFFQMFESEPVAPHFQGTIDLGLIDYDLDIDLSYFDDVAYYIRTFILALYVFGLILATREMFHIY